MQVKIPLVCLYTAFTFAALGCSGGGNPVEPSNPGAPIPNAVLASALPAQTSHSLLGYWNILISDDPQTFEIVPVRSVDMHLNVVHLLEDMCNDCLVFNNVEFLPDNIVSALMIIRHPMAGNLNFTVFDVRGIIITGKGYDFPASGKSMAWGDEVARMITYDGFTNLFNPTEFPTTSPLALGYIQGNRATGGDLSATLNPYAAFTQYTLRSMFKPMAMGWSYLKVYVPEHPIQFGYAVDVSWQLVEEPVEYPYHDFPEDANSLEAYRVSVVVGEGIEAGGGSAPVGVRVYDRQGLDTIESVTLEAPDLFSGTVSLTYSPDPYNGYLFTGTISNTNGVGYGDYPILARVVDTQADQNLGQIDAWQVYVLRIARGWSRKWGATMADTCYDLAINSSDFIYATGCFAEEVDFDPGPGYVWHQSMLNPMGDPSADLYLSCFNSNGGFQWVNVIASGGSEVGFDIALDPSDNIYITGFFTSNTDFDPSGGQDTHPSNGMGDVFLSKYDPSGNYLWTVTFGGPSVDTGYQVVADSSGAIYLTGFFQNTVDFDPGGGVDNHSAIGSADVFLVKLDSSGAFQWARTWGGSKIDMSSSVTVDNSGRVYVTGYFEDVVDFDPGPGTDTHTSNGKSDAFLSAFDSSGSLLLAYTWGGTLSDYCDEVGVDGSDNVYVVGTFHEMADLDPTGGTHIHIAEGKGDGFLIKFDSLWAFQWSWDWGGVLTDYPLGITLDGLGGVYVTGKFDSDADLDPSPGQDIHVNFGLNDAFLSKFDLSGTYQWGRTWGGSGQDYGSGLDTDSLGNVYVAGYFEDIVDFDAGPGFDLKRSNGTSDAYIVKYPPDGNW